MRRSLVLLFAMTVVAALLAMPGLAFADVAADNATCLSCHGPGAAPGLPQVDFAVGPVDRSSACSKCHWISLHPKHSEPPSAEYATRSGSCPTARRSSSRSHRPGMATSRPPTSAEADAGALCTRIHTKRTWVAEVKEYAPSCASCHAAATCEACHESALPHGRTGCQETRPLGPRRLRFERSRPQECLAERWISSIGPYRPTTLALLQHATRLLKDTPLLMTWIHR